MSPFLGKNPASKPWEATAPGVSEYQQAGGPRVENRQFTGKNDLRESISPKSNEVVPQKGTISRVFQIIIIFEGTLPETNSSHLKMDGWKTSFLLGWPIFRGYVSFRECVYVSFRDVPD